MGRMDDMSFSFRCHQGAACTLHIGYRILIILASILYHNNMLVLFGTTCMFMYINQRHEGLTKNCASLQIDVRLGRMNCVLKAGDHSYPLLNVYLIFWQFAANQTIWTSHSGTMSVSTSTDSASQHNLYKQYYHIRPWPVPWDLPWPPPTTNNIRNGAFAHSGC